MLVKDLMTVNVVSVTPDTKVSEVAAIMHKNHFSGLPVVKDDRVVGTISERDFITADSGLYLPTYIKLLSGMDYVQGGKKQLPHVVRQIVNATAKDIMNQKVPFVRPETSLEQLAAIFAEDRANPIPVTDENNNLKGIISRSDLIKFYSPKEFQNPHREEEEQHSSRMIDDQVAYAQENLTSRFAYVAKARANIWLTAGVVLFILGFLAGVVYVANPQIFNKIGDSSNFQSEQN